MVCLLWDSDLLQIMQHVEQIGVHALALLVLPGGDVP
jgi:hypothetical protein